MQRQRLPGLAGLVAQKGQIRQDGHDLQKRIPTGQRPPPRFAARKVHPHGAREVRLLPAQQRVRQVHGREDGQHQRRQAPFRLEEPVEEVPLAEDGPAAAEVAVGRGALVVRIDHAVQDAEEHVGHEEVGHHGAGLAVDHRRLRQELLPEQLDGLETRPLLGQGRILKAPARHEEETVRIGNSRDALEQRGIAGDRVQVDKQKIRGQVEAVDDLVLEVQQRLVRRGGQRAQRAQQRSARIDSDNASSGRGRRDGNVLAGEAPASRNAVAPAQAHPAVATRLAGRDTARAAWPLQVTENSAVFAWPAGALDRPHALGPHRTR